MFKKPEQKRVYLDYAAATPLSKVALSAMQKVMKGSYANPSAIHKEGAAARVLVENARRDVAGAIQVRPEFVTFTSGGTESNNIAIIGLVEKLYADGRVYEDMEVLTTKIEHPSVTNAVKILQDRGVRVQYIPVKESGVVDIEQLSDLISGKTVLVTLAYVNSEVGTIQPLHAIQKQLKNAEEKFDSSIYLHLDAAQAPLWLSCQFSTLRADLISFDFAKCNGPKGVGALVRSSRTPLSPGLQGGGQKSGLRSGTENVAGIVGGSVAFVEAQLNYKEVTEKVAAVRDESVSVLQDTIEGLVLNGGNDKQRVANNINISIPGMDTEYLAVWLDSKGYAVSTKSACAGAGGGESAVVKELTNDPARASSTLRMTLGPDTTVQNLQDVAAAIREHQHVMHKLDT